MKKGFTLIELLAVIAVLGFILAIAIPQIVTIIENSRINAYKNSETTMIRSAKSYFVENYNLLPKVEGDTIEVTLATLISEGFSKIISDKNGACDGYVLITNIGEEKFTYSPQLKCGDANTIGSSEEDRLIVYYSFDDFQEPTENLILNNNFENNSILGWYISNAITGSYNLDNLISFDGNVSLHINVSSGGDQHQIASKELPYDIEGKNFFVSAFIKTKNIGKGVQCLLYWKNDGGEWIWNNIAYSEILKGNNEWKRIGVSGIAPLGARHVVILIAPVYPADGYGEYWIDSVQIEEKKYITPFTNTIRQGLVKDYSGNNNNSALNILTTPRWLKNNDNGYYEFDGVKSTIIIPNFNLEQNIFTFSTWIKPNADATSDSKILTPQSNGIDQSLGYRPSDQRMILMLAESGDTNERPVYTPVNSILKNEWSYFNLVINNNIIKMYVNGNLVTESVQTLPIGLWLSNWFLGQRSNNTFYFKGALDDVKIYRRALSEQEIKYQYDINKNKYE